MVDLVAPVLIAGGASTAAFVAAFGAARGSRIVRRFLIAIALTSMAAVPLILGLALAAAGAGRESEAASGVGVILFFVVLVLALRYVAVGRGLPAVSEPAIGAQVAALAQRSGLLSPPRILSLPSLGARPALAFAGGLAQPVIILSDGLLNRLEPAERDAIIAHELAHLSLRTLWILASLPTIAATAAVAITPVSGPLVSLTLFLALTSGLRRIVGRRIEVACDIAGARVVGFASVWNALDKVHATAELPPGRGADLFYAIATHPPQSLRRAALRDAAPSSERASFGEPSPDEARSRTLARSALGLWLALIAAGLLLALASAPAGAALLFLTGVTPAFVPLAAFYRQRRRAFRRAGGWRRLWRLGLLALIVAAVVATLVFQFWPGMALVLLLALFMRDPGLKARRQVLGLLRTRSFAAAVKLGEAQPRLMKRDALFRHNVLLSRAMLGDRAGAAQRLEESWKDARWFSHALLTAAVLRSCDDPSRSLEDARLARSLLSDDPSPILLEADALRRLGRLDEAKRAVDEALLIDPRSGLLMALDAEIASERGDSAGARLLIAEAERRAPGDTFVLVMRASILLDTKDPEAPAAVTRAAESVRGNPFAFREPDIARLEDRLKAG